MWSVCFVGFWLGLLGSMETPAHPGCSQLLSVLPLSPVLFLLAPFSTSDRGAAHPPPAETSSSVPLHHPRQPHPSGGIT